MQLKIAYSVHQDLNVKANNDKSWDYIGLTPGGASIGGGGAQMQSANGYGAGPHGGANPDEPPTGVVAPQHSHVTVPCRVPYLWKTAE